MEKDKLTPKFGADYASRLDELYNKSEQVMDRFRRAYRECYRQFAGDAYCGDDRNRIVLNKFQQGIMILSRVLAARSPRCLVRTDNTSLRPLATTYQRVLNRDLKGMRLESEIQRMNVDGLIVFGIGKVGICATDEIHVVDDVRFDPGKPFISRVSPDNFFYDTAASTIDSCQFMGDVVEVDYERVTSSGLYGTPEEVKEWIGGCEESSGKRGGIHAISGANSSDPRLYKTVFMREIYLPREQMIVSMPVGSNRIVREQKWLGPKSGPYEMLCFMEMPDNITPVSVAQSWMHMAVEINREAVKLCNQADRQKTIFATYGSPGDAKKIMDAHDGDAVAFSQGPGHGGKNIGEEVTFGGINQQNFVFLQSLINMFNDMAGNLSLLGGLSPQSSTLGQDEMLNARASVMEFDMKSRVVGFTKNMLDKYAFFHWSDPFGVMRVSESFDLIEGILSGLSPEDRDVGFDKFGIEIIPYSLEYRSPKSERAEYLDSVDVVNRYLPESDYTMDLREFVRGLEDRGNIGDLHQVFKQREQIQQEQTEGSQIHYSSSAKKSPVHTENRVSTATDRSTGAAMADAMVSAGKKS